MWIVSSGMDLTTYLDNVEAMPSKVILMMPKNQELSKFQRFKNQDSRIIKIKIQESREDLIKISTKKGFSKY